MLYKPLFIDMAQLRPFKTYTGVQTRIVSAQKVGVAHTTKIA